MGNAWLGRKQHKYEQAERRRVIEVGIYEEFRLFSQSLKASLENPVSKNHKIVAIPRLLPLVVERLIQDLGLLEDKKAQAALNGVMTLKYLEIRLVVLALDANEHYLTFDYESYEYALVEYEKALQFLQETVTTLELEHE